MYKNPYRPYGHTLSAVKATRLHGNPLVGWETNKIRPSEVHSVYRILTGPRSQEYYAEAFRNVPFNLHVVVIPRVEGDELYRSDFEDGREPRRQVRELARRSKQVVLVLRPDLEVDSDVATKYAPGREARYTPFVLLHRLFDVAYDSPAFDSDDMSRNAWDIQVALTMKPRHTDPQDQAITMQDKVRWFPQPANWLDRSQTRNGTIDGLGVDTAAGRTNALADSTQAVADLFAKYCMTGRIAFDPYALPSEVTQEELDRGDRDDLKKLKYWMQVRAEAKKTMKVLFDGLIAVLQEGDAFFI